MKPSTIEKNTRLLIVDDNQAIHDDFRKILCPANPKGGGLEEVEAALFESDARKAERPLFELDSALQGQQGLALVTEAVKNGRPYSVAFVDVRMPPGWDGVETASRIWAVCPDMQIVLCTAYSDYSWDEMTAKLKCSDKLVILKKPFDAVEVLQLATALTEKWRLHQESTLKLEHLEKLVEERTQVLREQAALLDLATDAIFVRDLEGTIHFWNKGAERLYGWTQSEAVGKTMNQLFARDGGMPFKATEKTLLERGEWHGELRKRTKDGDEVIVDSRWTLLRDHQGQPRSVLVINTNITEKKKLETQFLRAQRMEGIGTLATGMAHDLNNILAPILMSAGTLRWELSADERELAINRIEMSVKRGASVIQQVLTFGRGVSGDRTPINPGELMEEALKIIGQTFPKDIEITVHAEEGLWPVIGDKTQLHQVLLNLSINARDAMPKGGKLSIEAGNHMVEAAYAAQHSPLQPGPHILLQVRDTGSGIAAGDLERIFDPFFTTKEVGKGTGLGLSTVLGIVKSHQGVVTVETKLDHGTVFKVLLPASLDSAKGDTSRSLATLPHGHGERILIVDDEVSIVSANRRLLEKYGYEVAVAGGGEEALSVFTNREFPFDLVVTDVMMPSMSGIKLVQELRQIDPRIKVIASSGLGRDLALQNTVPSWDSLGVRHFLQKPYTVQNLLIALHEALGGREEVQARWARRQQPAALAIAPGRSYP